MGGPGGLEIRKQIEQEEEENTSEIKKKPTQNNTKHTETQRINA